MKVPEEGKMSPEQGSFEYQEELCKPAVVTAMQYEQVRNAFHGESVAIFAEAIRIVHNPVFTRILT